MKRSLTITCSLLLVPLLSAAPAQAASCGSLPAGAGLESDFDGNGYNDIAIAVPFEDVGLIADAGAVQVLYAADDGSGVADEDDFFTQDTGVSGTSAIPGTSGENDRWGWVTASGDFDADGFCDLAIGAPYESVGGNAEAGRVTILYGSSTGLVTGRAQVFTQDTTGVAGVAEVGDRFGMGLVAGNFGKGQAHDLAIGAPFEALETTAGAGQVHILYGGAAGLRATGDDLVHQDIDGLTGISEVGDHFGAVLAAANLGRSSFDDLVVGIPDEDVGSVADAGSVQVIFGSRDGITGADLVFSAATTNIKDAPGAGDRMGFSVATGNFGRTGSVDLAIGSPGSPAGEVDDAGKVHVLYGSADGPTTADVVLRHVAEWDSLFGYRLTAGNMRFYYGETTDELELAVGIPGEKTTHVYKGTRDGLGDDWVPLAYEYYEPSGEMSDAWSYGGLSLRHVSGSSRYAELISSGLFVEWHDEEPTGSNFGMIEIHAGSACCEDAPGYTQDKPGIKDRAEVGDQWGRVGNNQWYQGLAIST